MGDFREITVRWLACALRLRQRWGRIRPLPPGYTITEVLLVVVFVALVTGLGATAWYQSRGRMQTASVARTAKMYIHRARMQAIYTGANHFIVLDRADKRLEIYTDTGSTEGEFDSADERVAGTHLKAGVDLALPGGGSMPNPLGTGTVSDAWSLPVPSGGAWKPSQRGVMVSPRGVFQSAEPTPQDISSGTIIFSTPGADASAVTFRGTLGAVRSFEYREGTWSEL